MDREGLIHWRQELLLEGLSRLKEQANKSFTKCDRQTQRVVPGKNKCDAREQAEDSSSARKDRAGLGQVKYEQAVHPSKTNHTLATLARR